MKNSAKYLIVALILAVGVVGVSFYSCEKEEITPNEFTPTEDPNQLESTPTNEVRTEDNQASMTMPINACGEMQTSLVLLADGETVGNATYYNDSKYFYIEVSASRGYFFGEAYMHIAYDLGKFPRDKNDNPDVRNFAFKTEPGKPDKVRSFKIPMDRIYQSNFMVALAVKAQTDPERPGKEMLAWVGGVEFGNTLKGRVFKYRKEICPIDEPAHEIAND